MPLQTGEPNSNIEDKKSQRSIKPKVEEQITQKE